VRVYFDATLDEAVDASLRALSRSRSMRSFRWADYVGGAILTGIVTGFGIFLLSDHLAVQERLITCGIVGVIAACLFPFLHAWTIKRRLRKYYAEQLRGKRTFSVEVELSPAGVIVTQNECTIAFAWPQVDVIEESLDTIDFFMRNGGSVTVRKRAFQSRESIAEFVQEAMQYFNSTHDRPVSA